MHAIRARKHVHVTRATKGAYAPKIRAGERGSGKPILRTTTVDRRGRTYPPPTPPEQSSRLKALLKEPTAVSTVLAAHWCHGDSYADTNLSRLGAALVVEVQAS